MHDYANFASPLPHPGEVLREDYMAPMGLTPGALARAMGLKDRTRIERISRGLQPITADTALRLAKVLGTSPEFWMNMQAAHELSVAAIAAGDELANLKPVAASTETVEPLDEPEPHLLGRRIPVPGATCWLDVEAVSTWADNRRLWVLELKGPAPVVMTFREAIETGKLPTVNEPRARQPH